MPHPTRLIGTALGLFLGSAGLIAAQAEETLTIGISQFAPTLHPNIESASAKSFVIDMAHRRFTTFDADWQAICLFCTELPSLENGLAVLETTPEGEEGIAVTFTIPPEAAWGDGTPVTTADVMFTWEAGRAEQSQFGNLQMYREIYDITVVDDKTFTIHRDRVTYRYDLINDLRVVPAHLERAIWEENPAEYPNRTLYVTDPTNPGLWFGPYRVTEVESGAYIALEKNDTWYGHPPYFDRIVVRTIENTAALEANLLSGSIDKIHGSPGLTIDQALAFADRHGDDYNIIFQEGLIYEHIDVNHDNPILADIRIRQALMYAADRQTMVEQLFGGYQRVAPTSISPLDWIQTDDVGQYDYDPDRAIALLEEAGFTDIRDGVRHHTETGERLSLDFMTTAGNRTRELVQQVLQSGWSDVGIEVVVSNQPARVFFGGTLSRREFTGLAMFAWISSPENVPRTILHSEGIPTAENGWAGQNYMGFNDPRVDELIDTLEITLDAAAREPLWHELQQIYAEQLPALPLYHRADSYILPVWLGGVVPTGHQYDTAQTVEYWHRTDR